MAEVRKALRDAEDALHIAMSSAVSLGHQVRFCC